MLTLHCVNVRKVKYVMNRNVVIVLLCAICLSTISNAQTAYESMRDSLMHIELDSANGRLVEGLIFEDGLIVLSLDSGTVIPLRKVGGRNLGLVFIGRGSVTFTPNIETEKVNLRRFYGSERFVEEVTHIVVAYTDDRLYSMLDEHARAPKVPGAFERHLETWQSLVISSDSRELDVSFARSMLNRDAVPLLFARAWRDTKIACQVQRDPYDLEPYSLAVRSNEMELASWVWINKCPDMSGMLQLANDGSSSADLVSTSKHVVNCEIKRSLDIYTRDELHMTVRSDSVRWLSMILNSALIVDSVFSGTTRLQFVREKDATMFWVQLPAWYRKGDSLQLAVHYHGDIIDRVRDFTWMKTSIDWLPMHSYYHRVLYDVTFTYPSSMKLFSVGVPTSPVEVGERALQTRWTTTVPNTNHSFHIGLFRSRYLPVMKNVPNATVHYMSDDQLDAVATDVQQSLEFFTRLFGPLDLPHLHATELPGRHGEAFPGLLHLSTYAFVRAGDGRTDDFFGEQFTAHEVAHQWWGISVKPQTYRDRYISEGFAEYSCLLYSQLAAREGSKFFRLLDEYRESIFDFGRRVVGANLEPPPIDLGHRVEDGEGQFMNAYSTFVYKKGAWVVHMLRNMMLDLRTMKEDVFMTVMREFYSRHKNGYASTEDLRRTIQDVTGEDLGWFFDQWVYGNKLPTYRIAWKKAELPKQEWVAVLQVAQEGVPDDFAMLVPVKIVGRDGEVVRVRVAVAGRFSQIELPHTKFEPVEVIFNDLSSVLCKVKSMSFKVEEKK